MMINGTNIVINVTNCNLQMQISKVYCTNYTMINIYTPTYIKIINHYFPLIFMHWHPLVSYELKKNSLKRYLLSPQAGRQCGTITAWCDSRTRSSAGRRRSVWKYICFTVNMKIISLPQYKLETYYMSPDDLGEWRRRDWRIVLIFFFHFMR